MRLPNVFDQLNDAVFVIDSRSDVIVDANPKACALLGYSRSELVSVGISAIHPDEIQEFRMFTRSVQAEGRGWTDELSCLTKSGDVLATEISASMIVIDGVSSMVAIVRPVSESRFYARHIELQRGLAVVEERNRLSREIHDTIAQSLTALAMRLDLVGDIIVSDPAAANAEFESLKLFADRCVEEVRRSIWDLRPKALDSSGLVEAVKIEMAKLRESGIKEDLRVSGAEALTMDRLHQSAALRVIQEALSNVIEHSKAVTAVVHLDFRSESFVITVTDDGVGFETRRAPDDSPTRSGFGITSMQERAWLVGGSVSVESAPGQGAVVNVEIPHKPVTPE